MINPASTVPSQGTATMNQEITLHRSEPVWLDLGLPATGQLEVGFRAGCRVGVRPRKKHHRSMNRCRMTVHYSGQVQGVGFRYTVKTLTPGYEVAGMVRNLPDGRVELVAEGDRSELEALALAVRESGVGPHIRDERVQWSEVMGNLRGFEIA